MQPSEKTSFWDRVEPTGFCWQWTGPVNNKGYGRGSHNGASVGAHRVAYMMLVGEIPKGLTLDHLCRNTGCVNPDHLEPVTASVNSGRAMQHQKQQCVNGHEYTDLDTLKGAQGAYRQHVRCRQCIMVRSHKASGIDCSYERFCDNIYHSKRREANTETCKWGHSMEGAYVRGDGRGLICKTCRSEQHRRKMEAKRA